MPSSPHDPAVILQTFIAFEEREQLFDRELLGVAYWQLIRHDIFRETLEALGLLARAHRRLEELPLSHWLGPQLRQLPRTLERSRLGRLPRADLVVATHPRHLEYRGQYICPYSQPLLWSTRRTRVLTTGHFQGRYFAPDAGEETRYVDLGLVQAHAAFRARELLGLGLSEVQLRELTGLAERLVAELGRGPKPSAWIRRARTAVLTHLGMTPWFEQLLAHVQPRLVVTVVGYRLVNQLLTLCARAQGIPVAELQHGTIGAAHAGYNFARGRKPSAFPDQLLTFGEIWRELTPGLPLPASRVHAVGYGWLELQRDTYPRRAPGARRRVLFLSQGDIGRELAELACAVREQLPRADFELVYRLHPSEAALWRTTYPKLAAAGITVETAQERALYAAQADADVQVGVYSTSLLEGVAFGLETYVASLPGHRQLSFLYERGLAQRVDDASELARALRQPAARAAHTSDTLWAKNPGQRFARFVEQTLRGEEQPQLAR